MVLHVDSEGIGFNGPLVLLQYAEDDGPVALHHVFLEPVRKTLDKLEMFCDSEVVAWNLKHDWFHFVKLYNILKQVKDVGQVPQVFEIADIEAKNPCDYFLRPKAALDLMIHATEGDYQFLMERKPFVLRRVPRFLAYKLIEKLNNKVKYDSILFAKYKKKESLGWEPVELSPPHPDLVDVRIKFNPSASLDAVGEFVVGRNKVVQDWSVLPDVSPPAWRPYGGNWRFFVEDYIEFWQRPINLEYASRDVELLQDIHAAWGKPAPGHMNGELSVAVANARWKGFALDLKEIKRVHDEASELVASCPINMNSPKAVKKYIIAAMDPMKAALFKSTGKATLEVMAKDSGEAGKRAAYMLSVRKAEALMRVFTKLLAAGRFHPNYNVHGALSSRMAGTGGINAQGLHKGHRKVFLLADPDEVGESGDFDAFETGIAVAVYRDPVLEEALLSGVKPHADMAASIYQESYEDILDTEKGKCGKCDGTGSVEAEDASDLEFVPNEWIKDTKVTCYFCEGTGAVEDKYGKGKSVFYASLYGAHEEKLALITGKSAGFMKEGLLSWQSKYPMMMAYQLESERNYIPVYFNDKNKLCWREPKMYAKSLLGFKRSFKIEFDTIRAMFEILQHWPAEWSSIPITVTRKHTKGEQNAGNACMSALIGAMFSLSSSVKRQANNHEIQATGAGLTKELQLRIWTEMQPVGIHEPIVRLMNTHDELSAVLKKGYSCAPIVKRFIEEKRAIVRLLGMTWDCGIQYWGDKNPREKVVC